MHIMEGYLPIEHAVGWTAASAPFVAYGLVAVRKRFRDHPEQRMLLGVAAAFTFILSALKLPSVTGSCSHPTGTGLGALLFGPAAMAPIGLVVLLFQALLLAHGGLTTLGANVFSMAIVGPFVAVGVFRAARGLRLSLVAFRRNMQSMLFLLPLPCLVINVENCGVHPVSFLQAARNRAIIPNHFCPPIKKRPLKVACAYLGRTHFSSHFL